MVDVLKAKKMACGYWYVKKREILPRTAKGFPFARAINKTIGCRLDEKLAEFAERTGFVPRFTCTAWRV